jgi:hypothetical protein
LALAGVPGRQPVVRLVVPDAFHPCLNYAKTSFPPVVPEWR